MSTSDTAPRRGEVWLINFDPTVGVEIRKMRPAVVVSSDAIHIVRANGRSPLQKVVIYPSETRI